MGGKGARFGWSIFIFTCPREEGECRGSSAPVGATEEDDGTKLIPDGRQLHTDFTKGVFSSVTGVTGWHGPICRDSEGKLPRPVVFEVSFVHTSRKGPSSPVQHRHSGISNTSSFEDNCSCRTAQSNNTFPSEGSP